MSFKDEVKMLFKSHKSTIIGIVIIGFILGLIVCSCNKDHIPDMPTMEETE